MCFCIVCICVYNYVFVTIVYLLSFMCIWIVFMYVHVYMYVVFRSHSVTKSTKPLSAIKAAQKKAALTTRERNFDIEVGRNKDTSVSPQMYSPPEELLMVICCCVT